MQILLDCVEFQKQKGFQSKRKVAGTIKNDSEALKELTELLQAIISESLDRDLPIDGAFAALHKSILTKSQSQSQIDYQQILDKYRNSEKLQHFRQNSKGKSLLQQIQRIYTDSLNAQNE